jgi:hypothetical protein
VAPHSPGVVHTCSDCLTKSGSLIEEGGEEAAAVARKELMRTRAKCFMLSSEGNFVGESREEEKRVYLPSKTKVAPPLFRTPADSDDLR